MGRLVELWKISDNESYVDYKYGPDKEKAGVLRIFRNGDSPANLSNVIGFDDTENRFFFLDLAIFKARQFQEKNEYPDESYAAS